MLRFIMIKPLNTKDEEEIVDTSRDKWQRQSWGDLTYSTCYISDMLYKQLSWSGWSSEEAESMHPAYNV